MFRQTFTTLALAVLVTVASAAPPSTISANRRFAYDSNTGWLPLRAGGTRGVVVTETFLGSIAYSPNLGWINFGDGAPTNGHTYSNTNDDFGVNLSPDGQLSGLAWSANTGWLRFDIPSLASATQARIDLLDGSFSGYAYSPNIGWLNLSEVVTDTLRCPDSDADGLADPWEMLHFGDLAASAADDPDADGISNLDEYTANTDPNDETQFLDPISLDQNLTTGAVTFVFKSQPGRAYIIQRSTDLQQWTQAGPGIFLADPGPTTARSFTSPAGIRHFYRATVAKPLP